MLALLVQQQARFDAYYVPTHILLDIEQRRAHIRHIKSMLRHWALEVEDLPDDEPPTPPISSADQASAALRTVAGLMSIPGVRADVMSFQESFATAWRQIDLLSTYKALHDLLHDLEFKCYRPMLIGTAAFPHNDLFRVSLELHESDLLEIIMSLGELADGPDFPTTERAMINQISQAAAVVREAIEQSSKDLLDRAIFLFERVLNVHPTRINERLKAAARGLPLDSLIGAMSTVRARLDLSRHEAAHVGQIGEGVTALRRIRDNLVRLIDEHDIWQMYDPELRQFEADPEQHIQQLAWLWQDLKPAVDGLCTNRSDRWTQDLRQASSRLERAIMARVAGTIAGPFHNFHSRYSLCFFRADKELKDQCFKLRLVDGPLQSVIGMLA